MGSDKIPLNLWINVLQLVNTNTHTSELHLKIQNFIVNNTQTFAI